MTIADIETLARLLVGADTNSLTPAQLLILDNKYYEEITGKIIAETAGAEQQRGDFNYTSFPNFPISMTNSESSYGLDDIETAGARPLTIMGVEVIDQNGDEHVVYPISFRKIRERGFALDNYSSTDGLPNEYLIWDNIIRLFPAPDDGVSVTLTNGLIIYYLRTADVFTTAQQTTGTKLPGFPTPWHYLMSYGSAADYADAKGLANAERLQRKYNNGLRELLNFISRRDQDIRKVMTGKTIRYI